MIKIIMNLLEYTEYNNEKSNIVYLTRAHPPS